MAESDKRIPLRNAEGYVDTTAHDALNKVLQDQQQPIEDADTRHYRIIKTVRNMIDLAGFELLSRIQVRDKQTGRDYW